jgi:hypothetical protein
MRRECDAGLWGIENERNSEGGFAGTQNISVSVDHRETKGEKLMGNWPEEENFDRAVKALERAEEKASYWFWPPGMDIVPEGAGAFAVNKPVTDGHVQQMIDVGVFCQGIINYILRFNGKKVPYDPNFRNPNYDGGTWANQRYFADFIRPFRQYVEIPRGALIGRYFRWAGAPGFSAVKDQGHVGVLLRAQDLKNQQDGLLLHSHPAVGGLNRTRLGASHANGYYDYWIHPRDWINHDKGKF